MSYINNLSTDEKILGVHFGTSVLHKFSGPENIKFLNTYITQKIGRPFNMVNCRTPYIGHFLSDIQYQYIGVDFMEKDMARELSLLNKKFINMVLKDFENQTHNNFSINDGMPTSHELNKKNTTPNDDLNRWFNKSARIVNLRDDPKGEYGYKYKKDNLVNVDYSRDKFNNLSPNENIKPYNKPFIKTPNEYGNGPKVESSVNIKKLDNKESYLIEKPQPNFKQIPRKREVDPILKFGDVDCNKSCPSEEDNFPKIDFYDFDDLNTNYLVQQEYNDIGFQSLNSGKLYQGEAGFGREDNESMRRVMKNIYGHKLGRTANGIRKGEIAITKRNYDMDDTINLNGEERDASQFTRGYNMSGLYDRVDKLNQIYDY